MPARRYVLALVSFLALVAICITLSHTEALDINYRSAASLPLDHTSLSGHAIAPKLGNETAKAELGRATWHYFHTVMARFPDKPTAEESATLKTYIHLFQRLYPCGECAEHFGAILKKFPPQTSSRSAAAVWACHVHNEVNKSLKKEIFDCANIGDFYDCGCAENEGKDKTKVESTSGMSAEAVVKTAHDKKDDLVLGSG